MLKSLVENSDKIVMSTGSSLVPNMNVPKISVSPAVSLFYSHFIWSLGTMKISKEDEIGKIADKVWEELPS